MQNTINRRNLFRQLGIVSLGSAILPLSVFGQQDQSQTTMIYIPKGEGKKGKVGEMEITFKLSGSQTGNQLGLWETVIQPGELGAPPHYHRKTDEICRVLEGTVTFMTGDTITEVHAGGWHLRPKNIVHTFWNSGKVPAKTIDLCIPAGHELYMQELAALFEKGNRPRPEDLKQLEAKHDIHFRFDLLDGITKKYKVAL